MDQKTDSLMSRAATHLGDVELGYFAHMRVAFGIGGSMIVAGAACLIHGLLPGLFQDRASRTVKALNQQIERGNSGGADRDPSVSLEFEI